MICLRSMKLLIIVFSRCFFTEPCPNSGLNGTNLLVCLVGLVGQGRLEIARLFMFQLSDFSWKKTNDFPNVFPEKRLSVNHTMINSL